MTEIPLTSIGERLRSARAARELSLGEVAARLGVSAATLSRIENNKQSLDLPLFLELTRILGVSAAGLLNDGDGKHSAEELIEILAALPSVERAQIFAAANDRSRGRRIAVSSLPARVDSLLQSLSAVRSELLDVRTALRRQR